MTYPLRRGRFAGTALVRISLSGSNAARRRRGRARVCVEALEGRSLLAVSATLAGTTATLTGDATPNTINARGDSLVGRTIVLDAPILNGRGRVMLGDGSWTVTGPDMAAGSKVRVAAVNGTELAVVPAP